MKYARTLIPPLVASGTATLAFNSFAVVKLLADRGYSQRELFEAIWPIVTVSGIVVILLMSFLYKSLRQLLATLEAREAAARHEALHDQLTGLANRALLNDRLQQALARCSRGGEKVGVLMLDLDRFKEVNDTWGHAAGDLLVQKVAQRISGLLRESDTIARLGGDEFAIVQFGPHKPSDVRRLCERIIEELREPFDLDGHQARIGVSIGAMLVQEPHSDAADVLRRADITMYHAKAAGRDCFRMFSTQMDLDVQRRHQIEQRLRDALADEASPEIHFQPQFDRSGAVVGIEALLRWRDPLLGQIEPQEVTLIAEECGLIDALGEVVVKQACAAARRWPDLTVAINISPLQFRNSHFARKLIGLVESEGVACSQIELEITENLLIQHGELCSATLQQLRRAGFRIALDDFGTGYSSLSYLRHFKVDKIKLDRSFIDNAEAAESVVILRAAVQLGEAMGLEVVAEGICDRFQESVAREAGCHGFQGFLYASALPADELDALLAIRARAAA
jgi:diguanylate cyclase (GGDEF)-like protein